MKKTKPISCCYNCQEREVGCHGKCNRYLEEKKIRDDRLKAKKQSYDIEAICTTISRKKYKVLYGNNFKK